MPKKRYISTQQLLDLPRSPIDAPSLPMRAQDAAELEHKFPYQGCGVQISCIWYWALQRFEIHNIDTILAKTNFKKLAAVYARNIIPTLGKGWEAHKNYIDWYLDRTDKFTVEECKYSIGYLSSLACLNHWLEHEHSLGRFDVVLEDEDRIDGGYIFGVDDDSDDIEWGD